MRILTSTECHLTSAAKAALLSVSVIAVEILVTNTSKFVSAGTFGGHRLNVILYPNGVYDLHDNPLNYDLSKPFFHNGHIVEAVAIPGGHIYKFIFDDF